MYEVITFLWNRKTRVLRYSIVRIDKNLLKKNSLSLNNDTILF